MKAETDMLTNKKRILIITDSDLSKTGVPMVIMSIVRSLKDTFDFDIIAGSEDGGSYKAEFDSYGGRFFVFKKNKPNSFFKKINWYLKTYRKNVKKFLADNNIRLDNYYSIHSFCEAYSYPFFEAAKKLGTKCLIMHVCAAYRAYKPKVKLKLFLNNHYRKKSMKLCSCIACSSDSTLHYNNYKNKGVVLYRTINMDTFGKIIECKSDTFSIAQIGTFSSRKNQLFSLRVLLRIKQTIENVKLYFVGKEVEQGYLTKMNNYIRDNNLGDNVVFVGPDPDRVELSRKTFFVVHPSLMEGSGNVLVEAQSMGIHCFASDTLPDGYDLGNVTYLPLNEDLWFNAIINELNLNGCLRKKPIGIQKFSNEYFKSTLLKIMNV